MSAFAAELARRVLICDGATGTMLHAAGNSLDSALPDLNLSDPDLVGTIHEAYIGAGADVIQTNTFGASRLRLAMHGAKGSVAAINRAGVRIAREAQARSGRPVFVAGSVSPAVTARQRAQVTPAERVAAIIEQVEALAEAGCDLLILETFGYLDELVEAAAAAAGLTSLPVIAQATFAQDGSTLSGESPREVAAALNELPIAALGTNCTLGPQHTLTIIEQLRRHSRLPVTAQPNAGLPRRAAGRRFEYDIDCDYFGRYAARYVEAGVRMVGGCCGTTPAHIQATAARIVTLRPRREARAATRGAAQSHGHAPADRTGLAERLGARQFAIAAEIAPPVGGVGDRAVDVASELREHGIDLFFVASSDSPRAQLSSLNLALHLRQQLGTEAIATVTTWDKTIMTLQADLLGAHALGLRAVVCETGNPPLRADYPNVDGIWEVDSVGLIRLLAGLNAGRDSNSLGLATKTSFHIGARFNPGAADLVAEAARTQAKLRSGAQFLISRPVYELDSFRRLRAELGEHDVPILLTIAPLRSFDQAEYLANEVPGVLVPDATLRALASAGADAAQAGLEMAATLVAGCRDLADGVVLCGASTDAQVRLLAAL
jgi:methionine synthase / methylenetetrahydrofolate reductase(NADPH)